MSKKIYLILTILSVFLLQGCCPKVGIDKSYTMSGYYLAINFTTPNEPFSLDLGSHLPNPNGIQLTLNSQEKVSVSRYARELKDNKILYVFLLPDHITEEAIQSLYINIAGYSNLNINFAALKKEVYQIEPTPIAINNEVENSPLLLRCWVAELLGHFMLPSANAVSCAAKKGSKTYYKPGTLIQINLTESY